jgi:hypothetical protein
LAVRYPLAEAWLAVPLVLAFIATWIGLMRVDPYASTVHQPLEVHRASGS